jgi:hypothetical protein
MRYHILWQQVQGTSMRRTHQRSRVRYPSPTTSKGLETHCHQATSKPSCMIASVSASKQGSYHRFSAHLILSTVGRRDIRLIDALKTSSITRAKGQDHLAAHLGYPRVVTANIGNLGQLRQPPMRKAWHMHGNTLLGEADVYTLPAGSLQGVMQWLAR